MAKVFMHDPATNRWALFDENGSSGAYDDKSTTGRNAPLNDPLNHLDKLYFHSDFNYLEVSHGPTVVNISHAAVAASGIPSGATIAFGWSSTATDHLLLTHSLGYIPIAIVAIGNNIIWPGVPVQIQADGGARFVSIYVTTTGVYLHEFASIGSSNLAATSLNYTVLVFRAPPTPVGNIMWDFAGSTTGILKMARDKFKSDRRYLQVKPGGSPFAISYGGKTIDLNNGAIRAIRADGTAFDPVPDIRLGLGRPFGSVVYGSPMVYGGSYTFNGNIQVQAP